MRKIRILKGLGISVLTMFLIISCNNITEPEYKEGSRDYVWEIDTLSKKYAYNTLHLIGGAKPTDVWMLGSGDYSRVLRFDGKEIKMVDTNLPCSYGSIYVINEKDIWFGGNNGEILHYNGTEIRIVSKIEYSDYVDFYISGIAGKFPDNFYASGWTYKKLENNYFVDYSFIAKYEKGKWRVVEEPERGGYYQMFYNKKNDKFYLGNHKEWLNYSNELVEFDGKYKRTIMSDSGKYVNTPNLSQLGDELTVSVKGVIYSIEKTNLVKLYDFSKEKYKPRRLFGRNRKDFFFKTEEGIAHYNGNDIKIVYPANELYGIFNAIFFEKEVFFLGETDKSKFSYLMRGKMK